MLSKTHFHITRRDFLKLTGTLVGNSLLAGCGLSKSFSALPEGQWAFCLHDYQLEGVWDHNFKHRSYPLKKAAPETVTTTMKEKFTVLTPDWQWFWYRNLIYCAFGHFDETKLNKIQKADMHTAWLWLTKGTEMVTNRHGPETNWEVITGRNKNKGGGYIEHDGLLAGGNIIRITGEKTRIAREVVYPFESLDGSKPPPDINEVNVETRPDLLQRATIAHYEQFEDGTFRVDPFPQLEKYNAHTVILNISRKQNHVPADRVRLVERYETPNPYNPPREMNFAK